MPTKKGEKRVIADIPEDIHEKMRVNAAKRNIPIKQYVLEALVEKMIREKQYE